MPARPMLADRFVAKFPRPPQPGKASKEEQLMHELKTWATLADHEVSLRGCLMPNPAASKPFPHTCGRRLMLTT